MQNSCHFTDSGILHSYNTTSKPELRIKDMPTKYSAKFRHKTMNRLKRGILFINITAKRIQIALELAERQLENVDFIIWIAPADFLSTLIYINEIKKNSYTFKHRIKYYAAAGKHNCPSKSLRLDNFSGPHNENTHSTP